MIIFSWTLTPNQVLALRQIADFHRTYEEAAAKKQFLGNGRGLDPQHQLRNWIGASRHLLKEGFAVYRQVPWEPWEKKHNPIGERHSWEITQKGLLVLQMVELEVKEQAEVLKIDKAQLRLLQKNVA